MVHPGLMGQEPIPPLPPRCPQTALGWESGYPSVFTCSPPTQARAASAQAVPAHRSSVATAVFKSGKRPFLFLFEHVQHTWSKVTQNIIVIMWIPLFGLFAPAGTQWVFTNVWFTLLPVEILEILVFFFVATLCFSVSVHYLRWIVFLIQVPWISKGSVGRIQGMVNSERGKGKSHIFILSDSDVQRLLQLWL